MRTTKRKAMRNWMLGLTVSAGLLTAGAMTANAAPQLFHDGRGEARTQDGFHGNRENERHFVNGDQHRFEQGNGDHRDGRDWRNHGGYAGGSGYDRGYVGGGYGYAERPVVESYIPPSPGDGYIWTAGYYNGGFWVPGAWTFRGGREFAYGRGFYGRGLERGRFAEHRFSGREFHGRR